MSIACSRWSIEELSEGEERRWMDCGSGGRKGKKVQHPVRRCVSQSFWSRNFLMLALHLDRKEWDFSLKLRVLLHMKEQRCESEERIMHQISCNRTYRNFFSLPIVCFSYKWIMWIIKSVGVEGAEQKGRKKRRPWNERWQANEKWTTTSWFLAPAVDTHWLTDSSSPSLLSSFFLFPSASCIPLSLSFLSLFFSSRSLEQQKDVDCELTLHFLLNDRHWH